MALEEKLGNLKRFYRRWKRAAAIITLSALGLTYGPAFYTVYHAFYGNSHPNLLQIEKLTDLKFQKDAKLLGSLFDSGMHERPMHAAIEIDRADMKRLTSLPGAEPCEFREPAVSDLPWWKPNECRKPVAVRFYGRANHRYCLEMLVGATGPRRATVYILYNGSNTL